MPLVTYSLWRLGLLLATLGVLWLVGVRNPLWLVGFGVLIAAALSYLLLAKQREATTAYLAGRAAERKAAGEDESVEDELAELGPADEASAERSVSENVQSPARENER